ncbi:MAG: hypothetical protein U0103_00450 [Candidatus Obscuribacterales bacterium]|nr:MAG: hypothetical protein EKK48_11715 [Candidatus Melainabacteria bacterium]
MKRRAVEYLMVEVAVLCFSMLLGSNLAAFGLPSSAFSTLQPRDRDYSQTEHGRMYNKQNSVASEDDKLETLQKDDKAETTSVKYGNSSQGGVTPGSGSRDIETQKPEIQAQKVKEQNFQDTLTQWSYWNIGNGVNIAKPIPPGGPNWYSFPPSRQIQAKPQAAAAMAVLKFLPQLPKTHGSAMPSNTVMQANYMATAFAAGQLLNAPKRHTAAAKANLAGQQQEISDSSAGTAENGFATSIDGSMEPLINVANEAAGTPTDAEAATKTYSQAIWMVQQIYKFVYVPLAILLLLPGAILTNLKGYLAGGIIASHNDEDAVSPFSGILRSIIAIFLIPATQLFTSWTIDVGNSMTYEVAQHIQPAALMEWMQEQNFNAPVKNAKNALSEATQGKMNGKIDEGGEKNSTVEQQGSGTRMLQMAFNMMNAAMTVGLLMMNAFQTVMICYLYLMAPIAAAFFAWPSGVGTLFKAVFANWLDALINVSLWKFWWCVVILCMQTRLEWLMEAGMYNPNTTWEMATYTAFMVILLYVPFSPFEYKPGDMVTQIMSKAEQLKDAGASKGGKKAHK